MRIGVEHLLAGEQRRRGQKAAVAADRIFDLEAVASTDHIVLEAVAGRRVHGTRAGIERHVIAEDHRHLSVVKRMLQQHVLELRALDGRR